LRGVAEGHVSEMKIYCASLSAETGDRMYFAALTYARFQVRCTRSWLNM